MAREVLRVAQQIPGPSAALVDLRDWPLPFFQEKASLSELDHAEHPVAQAWAAHVAQADGYIIVTPEYNHGYPAVLKNALDYAYDEWAKKPVAFVSYGGLAAGTRAVEQLRLVAIDLSMVPIHDTVAVPLIKKLVDDDGILHDAHFAERVSAMLQSLVWWMQMLKAAREKNAPA